MQESERWRAFLLLFALLLLFGAVDALVFACLLNMSAFYISVLHGAIVGLLAMENWSLLKDAQRVKELDKKVEETAGTLLQSRIYNALLHRQNEILLKELEIQKSKCSNKDTVRRHKSMHELRGNSAACAAADHLSL